jgi:hypothetical protein
MSVAIEAIESHFGRRVPAAYAPHLSTRPEMLRDDGLLLYGTENIVERNDTMGVQQYVTHFLAVGDDSGGRLVVVRFDDPSARPFLIDAGALVPNMPPSVLRPLSASWAEWERSDFPLPDD